MKISYIGLWKMLLDRNMTHADLRRVSGISTGTLTKLNYRAPVAMSVLWKICKSLNCNIGDIVAFEFDEEADSSNE